MHPIPKPERQAVNDWYFSSLTTRLDNPNTDAIVVIMQRTHEDHAGRLSEQGAREILALPAIAPSDITISLLIGRSYRWKKDEALHEQHASWAHLDAQRYSISDGCKQRALKALSFRLFKVHFGPRSICWRS